MCGRNARTENNDVDANTKARMSPGGGEVRAFIQFSHKHQYPQKGDTRKTTIQPAKNQRRLVGGGLGIPAHFSGPRHRTGTFTCPKLIIHAHMSRYEIR